MNFDHLKKKLLYQSTHRGCKELDIILGSFAEKFLMNLESESIKQYEELLQVPDNDIYNWVIEKSIPPKRYDTKLLSSIISFNKKKYDQSL
ncbi:FAD assembly factor SdhE [Candidatus Bandiella numerosa]|uniref:FAD assembly factor SdhE n=1 Tax=Candidatus Bandiella numerosa TaxID=2570586 RepID=UPI001F254975|nr:succinate dehydrogenase assembly factor 2 [Candidatus Bandiella numerosa]